jgi:opacity protein-like surface antigen
MAAPVANAQEKAAPPPAAEEKAAPPPAPAPAPAATVTATAPESGVSGAVMVGVRVGGVIPFDGLSPYVGGGLEAGYVFSAMNRSFAVALAIEYTAPNKDGTQTDPRLASASYNWHLTQEVLTFMPLFLYRMTFVSQRFTPYVGVGPRIFLMKSTVRGLAGSSTISETTEQSTKIGVGIPLGIEFALGPGAITAELLLQHASLDHTATGDSNIGAGTVYVGYRFLF